METQEKVKPKEGQFVRVVLEGRARGDSRFADTFYVGNRGDHPNTINLNGEHVKSVEVLPEPEDFRVGDIVRAADSGIWSCVSGEGTSTMWVGAYWTSRSYPYDFPPRPLTLLVRDGKAVAE